MSDREAEILKQQRLVAARLAASNTTKSGSNSSSSSRKSSSLSKKPPPPSNNKQASIVQHSIQRKQVASALKTPASSSSSLKRPSSTQKRPTIKSRGSGITSTSSSSRHASAPMTAQAAIAAAKTRVATTAAIKRSSSPPRSDLPSSFVARKTSQLAQLVSASMNSGSSDGDGSILTGSFPPVTPDDFWKHFRDWNVLNELCLTSSNRDDTTTTPNKKPLPETFVSHGHYIHAWAPLCLAEARAQVVSDFAALRNKTFVPVVCKTVNKDGGSTLDSMRIQVFKTRANDSYSSYNSNVSFMANDLVLLIPTKSQALVENALLIRGSSNSKTTIDADALRKHGLVAHVEFKRESVDGLQLRVSKRWWAVVGDKDMMLLKLGNSITAVREFTALCHVESLALKRYILGQHLMDSAHKTPTTTTSPAKSKTALLENMGGTNALGKGFISYVRNKFNPSQLAAISAAAEEYGDGGFTLCKGPPGTGKTSTLVAILNSLHIRQFNKYYEEVRRVAAMTTGNRKVMLGNAVKCKPRLLVCAPSNAAVDNVILKIMQDGFVDGSGKRYNPSIIRVGVGKSDAVRDVALEKQVNAVLVEYSDEGKLETSIAGYKMELQRIQTNLARLRRRVHALAKASPWPLSKDWEIRIDEETFEETGRVYFVNHRDKMTTFEVPPPPEPGEKQYLATSMPEYRSYMQRIVKLVENFNSITTKLERCTIIQNGMGANNGRGNDTIAIRQQLETHILDTVHIVCTTLGTAGNRVLESAAKFEVVVVDEAAQSTEPATLAALQLGSRHAVLVGDPQQLPATIFNVSGRNTKYDRSLFQRLEEAGQKVYMLNLQYRMHPLISDFPRRIFYGGNLLDGPNVSNANYGNPLRQALCSKAQAIKPFTLFDLDSKEHRDGTSLANKDEARLAVHLYTQLRQVTNGLSAQTRVAVITPYAQQANLLRKCFAEILGIEYERMVEVNTVDGYQGRESNIVIFSCVRAAGSHGVGFLSDVRRMNVALTRAKFFLFIIARCESIVVNPYWRDLVDHARDTQAVVGVPMKSNNGSFPDLVHLKPQSRGRKDGGGGGKKRKRKNEKAGDDGQEKPPGRPKEAH